VDGPLVKVEEEVGAFFARHRASKAETASATKRRTRRQA